MKSRKESRRSTFDVRKKYYYNEDANCWTSKRCKAPVHVKYYDTQDREWKFKYERPPVWIHGYPVDLNYMSSAQAKYILGRCVRCGRSTRCISSCKEIGLIPIENLPTKRNNYRWKFDKTDTEKNKKLAEDIFNLTKPLQTNKDAVRIREQFELYFLSDLGGKLAKLRVNSPTEN